MSTPEEIRQDIERTRAELSDNVNALGDSTSPSNVARGQVDKVKEGASNLKEKVFGAPEDPYDDGMAGEAAGRASGAVSDAREAVSDAPRQVKSRTRGNPIAAGLIAAGVGALLGGLIPASRKESDLAQQLKEAAQPVADEVKQMANEAKDNLQPVAQDAMDSLKGTAQEAGDNVKQDAAQAKDEVADQAKSSADTVKSDGQRAAEDTKRDAQQASGQGRSEDTPKRDPYLS